jgi:hypothetical protein
MLKRCTLLILATTAVACGGAGDDSGSLVGRWDLHDDETGELEAVYSFEADGSYRFREYGEPGETHAGTYETDGGLLVLEGTDDEGNDLVGEVTYFADDERFILGALLPDGEVDGPVGRWSGSVHVESDGEVSIDAESTYQLAADGSATIESRSEGERDRFDGTWADEEGEIVVSFEASGITFNIHMVLIEDSAMGSPVFRRADGQARSGAGSRARSAQAGVAPATSES